MESLNWKKEFLKKMHFQLESLVTDAHNVATIRSDFTVVFIAKYNVFFFVRSSSGKSMRTGLM